MKSEGSPMNERVSGCDVPSAADAACAIGRCVAGSICRCLLPTAAGALSDGYGLWAPFVAQAAMCAAGLLVIERWRRTGRCQDAAEARPKTE